MIQRIVFSSGSLSPLSPRIVHLFRAWATSAGAVARHCAEFHQAAAACGALERNIPAASGAEYPSLVRDDRRHLRTRLRGHRRTTGDCARRGLRGGISVVGCKLVYFALGLAAVAWEMLGGLGLEVGLGRRA